MGRMHSKGKGMSASAIPYSRNAPSWFKLTPDAVVEQIIKYARKGLTPSQIGVLLRDSHGVSQVKVATGNKILRILKSNERPCPRDSRGSLPPYQEGCVCAKAPRQEPKGRRLQVPTHSHRVSNPPTCPILQVCWCSAPHLEVRVRHCFRSCQLECLVVVLYIKMKMH
ncbi:Ribosomal 40S subunit protein S13, putative [Yarrowia lipolytica]|nr:Ribosomal 40S subunit protein S13, putative [Yarrowia lipolytica]